MRSSINCPAARGKRSLPLLFALLGLTAMSFLVYATPSKSTLLDRLTARLREGKFEQLYDESTDLLHRNVTRERFVHRMRDAVARMRAIDPGLNFKRDESMEEMLAHFGDESVLKMAAEKLEGEGKSASVLIHWDGEGNFSDISVLPGPETPQEYRVIGVSAYHYRIGDETLDW
jgi:hypothetical protein